MGLDSVARIMLLGLPLRLQMGGARALWRRCLGPPPWPEPREEPILTLTWRGAGRKRPGGRAGAKGRWLKGEGFALDLLRREMVLDGPGRDRLFPVCPGNSFQGFSRYVIFGVSLLCEGLGPRAVARAALAGQVPLSLHASAVAGPKGALVFCGHSAYGKSTISSMLLGRYPLIADDLATVLVSPRAHGPLKAPRVLFFRRWVRREALRHAARPPRAWALPLRGLFWLRKSPAFGLERLSTGAAAAGLLPPLRMKDCPCAARHRMRLLRALLEAVPCYRLSFRRESAPLAAFLGRAGFL